MKKTRLKLREQQFRRLLLVTAMACAMGDLAMAQTAASSSSPAGKNASSEMVLEEVIVTAQKRAEPLQKTPIALTAFSEGDLEKQHVTNLLDLSNIAPSVNIIPFAVNKAAPSLFIRGMGGTDTQTTKDYATGIYVDGVLIGRGSALAADVADLERVEVLRGPQGTLYGRNTTAGAVNFITRKPEKGFSFEQELDAGNYNLFGLRTRANIPLSENLYTRFTYMRSSNDGWVKNTNSTLPNQTDFNKDKKEALKWAFRWRASDNLMVDYSVDSSKMTYGNAFFQVIQGPTAFNGRQETTTAGKGLSPSDANVSGHNLTLSWDLGGAVLKSITGYRKTDSAIDQDYGEVIKLVSQITQDQTSQEFQLVGDTLGSRLKYVAGAYFFKENSNEWVKTNFSPTLQDYWSVAASSESNALYGQATWKPAILDDRLGLTLGLRDTRDTREGVKTFIASFSPAPNGTVVPAKKTFSKVNPTFTVDYAFSNDVNGYAKIGTGYRAGGFNTRSTAAGFAQGFNQENVRAYELGLKSDLLDHRLRVNVAAFMNKYTDLQVDQQRPGIVFTDTVNAGKARIKGLELEMKALLTKGLSANLFYSYLNGRYGSYVDNGVDLVGVKHMPMVPKGQGGLGLEYSPAKTDYGKLTFNLDYKWQEQWYTGPNADTLTPGYQVWNGRVELADIRAAKGTVRVAAWAKNLTDRKYRLATTNLGLIQAMYGEPRTVGLNLIYDY